MRNIFYKTVMYNCGMIFLEKITLMLVVTMHGAHIRGRLQGHIMHVALNEPRNIDIMEIP